MKKLMIILCILISVNNLYSQSKKNVPVIINDKPKYQSEKLLTLKELYSIPIDVYDKYYINAVYSMDVDKDTNLYVAEPYQNNIVVFDKKGKYIKTIGGKGQGPNELLGLVYLYIYDDKLYINQYLLGIKVWDISGKYITEYKNVFRNQIVFFIRQDYVLTCDEIIDRSKNISNFELQIYSKDFKDKKKIAEIEYRKKKNEIWEITYLYGVDSKDNIYFPVSRNEYKLNIYNLKGELIMTFGKKYNTPKMPKEILDIRKKHGLDEITKEPQVIQYIIIDNRDYVWIVPAWSSLEAFNYKKILANIDIFNSNGEYLYTFNDINVTPQSIIRNNRLYSFPDDEVDRNIRVFQIEYNNRIK